MSTASYSLYDCDDWAFMWRGSLEDFFAENDGALTEAEKLRARQMVVGEAMRFGGGAQPTCELLRHS